MRSTWRRLGSERGSVMVMVAVSLMMMLALAALAMDLGLLRDSKAQAQRAADAIALAGASAFRDLPWADAATAATARDRAYEIARLNQVRADTLDVRSPTWVQNPYGWGTVYVSETQDVTLNVIPDSQKVRAWVRRAGIRTSFAKLLARPFGHVQAMATAWATNNGPVVNCLKPFVMPDMWYESDKITQDNDPTNDYMDPITTNPGPTQDGESWKYEPASIGGQDYYKAFGDTSSALAGVQETGYGSGLRSGTGYAGDVGLPLLLKPQTGGGNTSPAPERMGNAFWVLDFDPNANTREEIENNCANATVGDSVPYDNGSRTGPVRQGINYLVQQDPGAEWDAGTGRVINSAWGDNWRESPRVVIVGLIDPIYWTAASRNAKPDPGSEFSNFARIFLLPNDPQGPPDNVHALFIGPAPGGTGGPTGGSLVKILQLIE